MQTWGMAVWVTEGPYETEKEALVWRWGGGRRREGKKEQMDTDVLPPPFLFPPPSGFLISL